MLLVEIFYVNNLWLTRLVPKSKLSLLIMYTTNQFLGIINNTTIENNGGIIFLDQPILSEENTSWAIRIFLSSEQLTEI